MTAPLSDQEIQAKSKAELAAEIVDAGSTISQFNREAFSMEGEIAALRRQRDDALTHLCGVLSMLAELEEDEQCQAFIEAMRFYNAACPERQVWPEEGYSSRIVMTGPLDRAIAHAALGKDAADA